MSRSDISPNLIHFTRGETLDGAFRRLQKIISDRKLIGSDNMIMGGHRCVCFSEAPLETLPNGLVNDDYYSKYSPFGITVSKKWLFEQGGRPVIYQPVSEYKVTSESQRWRHVTYELREGRTSSDFTWEREWRINCDELPFDQTAAAIVVRNLDWADRLVREHDDDQEYLVRQYSLILADIAELYRESFGWSVLPLG